MLGSVTSVKPVIGASYHCSQTHNSVTARLICASCSTFIVTIGHVNVLNKSQFGAQLHCASEMLKSQLQNAVTIFWVCVLCCTGILRLNNILHKSQFTYATRPHMSCDLCRIVRSLTILVLLRTELRRIALLHMKCDLGSTDTLKKISVLHKLQFMCSSAAYLNCNLRSICAVQDLQDYINHNIRIKMLLAYRIFVGACVHVLVLSRSLHNTGIEKLRII